ncbi:MAG: hypothetical protein K6F37_09885 [Lachnospiraceae bacterium]|nr:hypothetical protein [Lachnospiraceae bacterium]
MMKESEDMRFNENNEAAPIDIMKELLRFKNAKKLAAEQLLELYEKVFSDIGEEGASIIMAYQAMLEDPEFIDEIKTRIKEEGMTAENAVASTAERLETFIGDLDDEYMKARRNDIKDVAGRLIECLQGI